MADKPTPSPQPTKVKGTGKVDVSDAVRVRIDRISRDLCLERGVEVSSYNQTMNATVIWRALKEVGVNMPLDKVDEILPILKVGGNASGQKNRLMGRGLSATAAELVDLESQV